MDSIRARLINSEKRPFAGASWIAQQLSEVALAFVRHGDHMAEIVGGGKGATLANKVASSRSCLTEGLKRSVQVRTEQLFGRGSVYAFFMNTEGTV